MPKESYEFADLDAISEIEERLKERESKAKPGVFRVCSKCGETKLISNFSKDKRNSTGRGNICKVCRSKESLNNYYQNRDKILIKIKEYQDGKDRSKYFKDYKRKHKEHLKKTAHKWYKKNRKRIKKRNLELEKGD